MTVRYYNSNQLLTDVNGDPVVGAKKNYYLSPSSTTRKDTFTDAALSIAHANPVIALADGTFPTIFLESGVYNVITTDASDVTVHSQDNVEGSSIAGDIADTIAAMTALDVSGLDDNDYFWLMQPTSPFRNIKDIELIKVMLNQHSPASVVSVTSVGPNHPDRMYTIKNDRLYPYRGSKTNFSSKIK